MTSVTCIAFDFQMKTSLSFTESSFLNSLTSKVKKNQIPSLQTSNKMQKHCQTYQFFIFEEPLDPSLVFLDQRPWVVLVRFNMHLQKTSSERECVAEAHDISGQIWQYWPSGHGNNFNKYRQFHEHLPETFLGKEYCLKLCFFCGFETKTVGQSFAESLERYICYHVWIILIWKLCFL